MGAYNVVTADVACPACAVVCAVRVQFKHGDTWQHEYAIGDSLRWGGNDIGQPQDGLVIADGASEGCPRCNHEGDFEVWIRGGVIERVRSSSGTPDG
jgi:hypothetical protein